MPETTTEGHGDPDSYRHVAEDLITKHGWDHATFVATAVRGFVYGLPGPSPYRDQAEAIYEQLGWEQAALLASWFRDTRSRSTNRGRTP